MTDTGNNLSLKLTAPITALGAVAVKVGMDFEKAMSEVQAYSGATADELDDLEVAARQAGASTSKSATDAAKALGYMALAGWDTKTSIDALMPVLRLSEAGNIDLARASSLVTDSMSALGLTTQELPGYLDLVAQTARSSNTDIDQMAAAYLAVGGTLRGLDVELEESALAMGLLANAGIKGSEAGKSLNAILLNLTAPAGRAKQALDDLNFSAFDSEGNFKGLEAVLFELQGELADMTDEQRNMTLSMIGGKEHVKSLNALLNGLADSYVDLKTSIMQSDGALEDMATTMMDNNKGSLVALTSALEELALKVYDILAPTIAKVTATVQGLVDRLNAMDPAMQHNIVVMAGLAAAIGPVLLIAGKLTSGVGALITTFGTLVAFIKTTLIPAITGISLPVAATVGGVLALGAVAYEVYRAWSEVKTAFLAIWDLLKASAVQLGLNISIAFEEMKRVVLNAVEDILSRLSLLEKIPFGIGEKFKGLKDSIGDSVDGSAKKLEELRQSAESNSERIATAIDGTKVAFSDLGTKIADDVKGVIGSITGMTSRTASAMEEQTEIVEDAQTEMSETTIAETQVRADVTQAMEDMQTNFAKKGNEERTEAVKGAEEEQTETVITESNKRAEERAKYEQSWNDKLFKLTADRLELLEAEYEKAIAEAKELEADITDIEEYFELKRAEIREESNAKKIAFEQKYQEKIVELTGEGIKSKLELLEEEEEEALKLAEDLEADITTVKQYFSILRKQIIEEEKEFEREKYEEQESLLKSWEDRLFEATANEEELLLKKAESQIKIIQEQKAKELELAGDNAEAIKNINVYWSLEEKKVWEEHHKAVNDAVVKAKEELLAFEEEWQEKISDRQLTETEKRLNAINNAERKAIERAREIAGENEELAEVTEATITKIKEYHAALRSEVAEDESRKREQFEEQWNKKLFSLTADRITILEKEKDEQVKIAEKLGADTEAVRKYYEKLITQEQDKQAEERKRLAEKEAKQHKTIWQEIGLTIENVSKKIANNVIDMFDSNYKAEQNYKSKREKIQNEIKQQIDELEEKRLKELESVIDSTEQKAEIDRKYDELKAELRKEEKKRLDDNLADYEENRLSIKDVLKEMLLDVISTLQKQIMAQELAAVASAWAMSITTLGASLVSLAAALPKIALQVGALEALKGSIRGLATGGLVPGGTDQVFRLGDGKEDEAVLPLNASVFNRLAEGITQQMSTTNNRTITQNITIQSPTPLSPAEIARKNKQQLKDLAIEWGM